MKTIEQAATNAYSIEVLSSGCNAGVTFGKEMFKHGVEFAQRWISVEKEIPNNDEPVLMQTKEDGVVFGKFKNIAMIWSVTHWRPVSFL